MIFGTGIDLVLVSRIERSFERFGMRFAQRILGPNELLQFEKTKRPARFLAMRFAAKEAMSKALGTGFKNGVAPRLIEVNHNAAGKPELICAGRVKMLIDELGITASHISLTDEGEYAAAFVVVEK